MGLVSAACFAELGHHVTLVDNDERKVNSLRAGQIPIHEESLAELFERHAGTRIRFSSDIQSSFKGAEIAFITVGTPPAANGDADLSYVEAVARELASVARGRQSYRWRKALFPLAPVTQWNGPCCYMGAGRGTFSLASNPEFLRKGTAVSDFLFPDRIVVGADCERSRAALNEVYRPLTDGSYYQWEGAICGTEPWPGTPDLNQRQER